MAKPEGVELGKAWVPVMPSMENVSKLLAKEFRKAIPEIKQLGDILGTSFTAGLGDKLSAEIKKAVTGVSPLADAFAEATSRLGEDIKTQVDDAAIPAGNKLSDQFGKAAKGIGVGIRNTLKVGNFVTKPFNMALMAGLKGVGAGLSDTLSMGVKSATAGIATSVGAIGAQVIGGGLTRALGINAAEAKLHALGYQGEEFNSIMKSAGDAVDGTAFALSDSVGSTATLLAAGIKPGEDLTNILRNTAKLADISGRSFADMGSIMGKNAASGVVQMEDLNQLLDAGVPITSYLAKNLGKSVAEIKKMSSAGEITFGDLNNAVNSIDFDSALLASEDVGLAFRNVRSQLSKQGAELWKPIVGGLLPILLDARKLIMEFGKTFNFNPIQTKLAEGMEKLGTIFDRFKNESGDMDAGAITGFMDKITSKYERFKAVIAGFEGPVLGLIAGLSGSLLSGIPVIGPMFAGITPLVGLFAGTLVQAYTSSARLQETIASLGGWFSQLGVIIASAFTAEGDENPMLTFGNKLSVGIENVKGVITGVVSTIRIRGDEIGASIKAVWTAVREAIGGTGDFDVTDIGNVIVDVIKTFAGYLETVLPIIIKLGTSVVKIVTSDGFQKLFTWLANTAAFVAKHEGALIALGVTLTSLFIAGKLAVPIMSAVVFFAKLKIPPAAAAAGPALGGVMSGFIKGFGTAMAAVLKATPYILMGLVGLALILAALAGIGWLANLPGVMDALRGFGDVIDEVVSWVTDSVGTMIETLMPVLTFFKGFLLEALAIVGDRLVQIVESIGKNAALISTAVLEGQASVITATTGGMASIATAIAEGEASVLEATGNASNAVLTGVATLTDSIGGLLQVLAKDGEAAGVAAFSAAAGILALMTAFGAGSATAGIGNAIGTIFSGMVGQDSPLELMLQAIERLAAVNDVVLKMPISWGEVLVAAYTFGVGIPLAIANGINSNSSQMAESLSNQIDSMLEKAQSQLDASPLKLKLEMEDLNKTGGPVSASSGNGGRTINNSTRNNNVTYNSTDSIDTLLRYGR